MKRKVCVITGTRAEYGLLRKLMKKIEESNTLELQIVVTGMHLSSKFGSTYMEIEEDGFYIDEKIELPLIDDSPLAIANAIASSIRGFSESLEKKRPDLIVVLGDRFEIFGAVTAAQVLRIPVAHIHGGEATEGLIDEALRHSITKMSHLHFAAANEYRNRIIQLGESPSKVFLVGGMGVDAISTTQLKSRKEIERELDLKFSSRNLLITFHPVTLENQTSKSQVDELLEALSSLRETTLIFTLPNADQGNAAIFDAIHTFVTKTDSAYEFKSLGENLYLSCLNQVDGVVGNSSSGLTEAPSFKKGTINIGDRQRGRLKAKSVIDCEPNSEEICRAVQTLYSGAFQLSLENVVNPYGEPGASEKIVNILEGVDFSTLIKKKFHDLEFR